MSVTTNWLQTKHTFPFIFFVFFPQQISNTIQSTSLKSQTLYLKQVIWDSFENTKRKKMSNKCSQHDLFATAIAVTMHPSIHATVEKEEEKCNQCDFAYRQTGDLRSHLKIHSWKKSNNSNKCDNAGSGYKSNECN